MDAEPVHQRHAVRLDRLDAEIQTVRDRRRGMPVGEEPQNLGLSRRQAAELTAHDECGFNRRSQPREIRLRHEV